MKILKNKWVKGILFFFLWIFMFGISPKLWGVVNLLIGGYYFYNQLYKNEKFRTKNKIIKIVIGSFIIFFTLSFGAAGLTYDEKEMLAQKEQQEQQKLQKQQDEEQKKIEEQKKLDDEQKKLEDEQKKIEEQKRAEEEAKKVKEEDKKKAEELAAASVSQVASNETTTVESSKQDNNVSNTPSSSSSTANSSSVPAQAENKSDDKKVYWTPKGKSYHFRKSCSTLLNSKTINEGPLSSCPKSDPCDKCAL